MFRSRFLLLALFAVVAIVGMYVWSDPQMGARYAQAQRDAALSSDTKQTVMLVIALAIAAYLAWLFLIRKN